MELDRPRIIGEILLGIPILLGVLLALLAGIVIRDRLLGGVASKMGFFFGYVVFQFVPVSSIDSQVGLFVVFEMSYLVIWLSIINRTTMFAPRERKKAHGRHNSCARRTYCRLHFSLGV